MGSGNGRWVAVGTILVVVGSGLVGCSAAEPKDRGGSTSTPAGVTRTPTVSPTDTSTAPEVRPTRYQPNPAEVDAAAKRTAARAVEALPDVRQVTYTQYFGYLPPKANILVEADFADGGGTTYAVEISQAASGWQVDAVTPAEPVTALSNPGSVARRVLDSGRIALPWAAREDVAGGLVSDAVLRSMLAVAKQHEIGISVLVSAHPVNVFGTDRRSNHPDGLAYDIGSIDGRLVVDPGAAGLVQEVMRLAAATGAYQVGGPDDLDDGGSQYFSDPTHSDHIHVGFNG